MLGFVIYLSTVPALPMVLNTWAMDLRGLRGPLAKDDDASEEPASLAALSICIDCAIERNMGYSR